MKRLSETFCICRIHKPNPKRYVAKHTSLIAIGIKLFIVIFISIIGSIKSYGQNFDTLLSALNNQFPQEKIYAHLDKDNYFSGEDIWFKVYILSNGLPGSQSSDCYVELVSANGKVINKKILPVYWGTSSGNMAIPDSLPTGNYFIRCYTAWMLNFNNASVFSKGIYIYNFNDSLLKKPTIKNIYSIQFLPEGGNIVNDVNNVIAFKAVNQFGYPANVAGEVLDNNDSAICSLQSFHDGMGKIVLKPKVGKTYHAVVKFPGNETQIIPLPQATILNMTLRIEDLGDDKKIFILRGKAKKTDTSEVIVVAQINGKIVLNKYFYLTQQESFYTLNTSELPSGIMQITLFNNKRIPISERLVFINNNNYSTKSYLSTDSNSLSKEGKNVFTFFVPDSLEGSFSISVTDDDLSLPSLDKSTLVSQFLFSSELNGNIYNPSYYFIYNSDSIRQALDLVLLTNGWRRFKWNDILNSSFPSIKYFNKNFITVKGQVINSRDKKPVKGGDLNFIFKTRDMPNEYFQSKIDSAGFFTLDSLVFYGNATFFFTCNDKKGKTQDVQVILKKPNTEPVSSNDSYFTLPISNIDFSEDDVLKFTKNKQAYKVSSDTFFNKGIITLKEVKVKNKKGKSPLQLVGERYASSLFAGPANRTLDLINNPTTADILKVTDLIKDNFPDVMVVTSEDIRPGSDVVDIYPDKIYRKNIITNIYQSKNETPNFNRLEVTVYIDEQQVPLQALRIYKSSDIALIKYYNFFPLSPMNGPAIVLYTKKGADLQIPSTSSVDNFFYQGYSYSKEFYSPDYSIANSNQPKVDTRVTLFWNPDVIITKEIRTRKIIFYNSDVCKRKHVTIEGFNSEGKLCHIEKIID